jgi:hypothetical protein
MAPAAAVTRGLLTRDFLRRVQPGADRSPERVRLGRRGLDAYRYDGLPVRGELPVTVYTVPTSAGVATIACTAECGAVAQSLTVDGPRVFPVGPVKSYGAALQRVIAKLDSAVSTGIAALEGAPTPGGQSDAAATTKAAFQQARRAVGRFGVSPADTVQHRALGRGLKSGASAYGALSTAAAGSDGQAYARASRGTNRARGTVNRALRALAAAGYRPIVRARLSTTAIPSLRVVAAAPPASITPVPTPAPLTGPASTPPAPAAPAPRAPAPTPPPAPAPAPKPTPIPAKPTPIPGE